MADDLRALTSVPQHIIDLAAFIQSEAGDDALAFVDTLDGCSDVVRAARNAVRAVQAYEAQSEAGKALAARYAARAKDFDDRAARIRDALAHFMSEIAAKTLVLPEATITLAVGQPSLTGEADPAKLPDSMVRISRVPDRAAIKAALNKGETVEGYSLSNARPRLQIRGGKAASE